MVLQRGRPIPVWGWTTPGAKVSVAIGGKMAQGVAGADGRWQATLPAMKAGGPYTLTIAGPQQAILNNVMLGDVWICSGQSNMQFGVGNLLDPDKVIAQADNPNLRLFTVGMNAQLSPTQDVAGSWLVCNPTNIKVGTWNGFSAVAYFFGQALQKRLGVPIGLIHTSWGGTPAEAWTSAQALRAMGTDFDPALAQVAQWNATQQAGQDPFELMLDAWYAKNDRGSSPDSPWQAPALDDSGWTAISLPTQPQTGAGSDFAHFSGVMWLRHDLDLPAGAAGNAAALHLGPIWGSDTVWVNGTQVGATDNPWAWRNYSVPARVLKAGANEIAIRTLCTDGFGVYGPADQLSLQVAGSDLIPLAGDWKSQVGVELADAAPLPLLRNALQNEPSVLYNGMIAPLIPIAFKGVIWYQGESNAGRSYQYRKLLPAMIEDWRARWGEGDFPFLIVQLPNFGASQPEPSQSGWAELREAQLMTWQHLPKTGMVETIDIGDANDIHPKDKLDVGNRLALAAMAVAYGERNVEYSGPIYKSMTIEGNTIRLTFDHLGGGLVAKGGGKLTGFAIAGADRKWHWADARIEGNQVAVSSPDVPNPVAVRYAWADNPVCNLFGAGGLPASPFRTDDWPGVTLNNR